MKLFKTQVRMKGGDKALMELGLETREERYWEYFWINPLHISAFQKDDEGEGTWIFVSGESFVINNTPEEIEKIINEAK